MSTHRKAADLAAGGRRRRQLLGRRRHDRLRGLRSMHEVGVGTHTRHAPPTQPCAHLARGRRYLLGHSNLAPRVVTLPGEQQQQLTFLGTGGRGAEVRGTGAPAAHANAHTARVHGQVSARTNFFAATKTLFKKQNKQNGQTKPNSRRRSSSIRVCVCGGGGVGSQGATGSRTRIVLGAQVAHAGGRVAHAGPARLKGRPVALHVTAAVIVGSFGVCVRVRACVGVDVWQRGRRKCKGWRPQTTRVEHHNSQNGGHASERSRGRKTTRRSAQQTRQ